MKPRWKAQLGGSSFTKTEAAQVVQREETQLKQNCKKTNIRTPEGRPEGVEMKRQNRDELYGHERVRMQTVAFA